MSKGIKKNNVCSFNISAEFKDNSLSEQSSIALAKTLLTPDEYTVLKNSLEKVDTENNKKLEQELVHYLQEILES